MTPAVSFSGSKSLGSAAIQPLFFKVGRTFWQQLIRLEKQTSTHYDNPVHEISDYNNRSRDAAGDGNIEAIKQHIAAGTDINATDFLGWTPLRYAASSGEKEAVEILLDNGADVNVKDEYGSTPLHDASLGRHNEVVELLISRGADVNAKRKDGDTPLDKATMLDIANETADLLRKHGGKTGEELKAAGN